MVLFDEFDKTFGEVQAQDGEASPQANLLSLFDGVSGGKKLFVITCNELRKLNDYLINRPGRFHYHFRFDYPSAEEVKEYLKDKIPEEYYGQIDSVVSFSRKVNLNYDCLRAIAFEISSGITFKDAIKDLNIVNLNATTRYNITLHYSNGIVATAKNIYLDIFGDEEESIWLADKNGHQYVCATFNVSDVDFDTKKMASVVRAENISVTYDDEDRDEYKELIKAAKESEIEYIALNRQYSKDIHYAV